MTIKEAREAMKELNDTVILTSLEGSNIKISDILYDGKFVILIEGHECISVKKFLDITKDIPDNTFVVFDQSGLMDNNENILRYIAYDNSDLSKVKIVALVRKSDEDVYEELSARIEECPFLGMSDADIVQEAFDDGFTIQDFEAFDNDVVEFVKRTKTEYGLLELSEKVA